MFTNIAPLEKLATSDFLLTTVGDSAPPNIMVGVKPNNGTASGEIIIVGPDSGILTWAYSPRKDLPFLVTQLQGRESYVSLTLHDESLFHVYPTREAMPSDVNYETFDSREYMDLTIGFGRRAATSPVPTV